MLFLDIKQDKLDVAKKLGADEVYLTKREVSENENVKKIHELFGDDPDQTIDASGAQASIRLAILVSMIFILNKIVKYNHILQKFISGN